MCLLLGTLMNIATSIRNLAIRLAIASTLGMSACSLPSTRDCSNIILGVPRSNHKEQGKFKDDVIKKNNLGEEEKILLLGDC